MGGTEEIGVSKWDRDATMSSYARDASKEMQGGLAEMGIKAEFANPVSRAEVNAGRGFASMEPPKSLIGPGKFRNVIPANPLAGIMHDLPFSSIALITRRSGYLYASGGSLNTSFDLEASQLLDEDLVAAAQGVLAIHDTAAIYTTVAKTDSFLGVMGRKESNPVPLTPDAVADVLEYDEKVWDAFSYYLRSAGFPIAVKDVAGMTGDEIELDKTERTSGVGVFSKSSKKDVKVRQGLVKLDSAEKELLDNTLTRSELSEYRKIIQNKFGKGEEQVAFALAASLGVFILGPRAREHFVTPPGDKKTKDKYLYETTNPLFIGHARTIMESEWISREAVSFLESARVNMGAKGKTNLADVISMGSLDGAYTGMAVSFSSDMRQEFVVALRSMPEAAVKNYWKKMRSLKEQHDMWGWIDMDYSPDGAHKLQKGEFKASDKEAILVSAVDSLTISEETAKFIASKQNFLVGFKFKP